VPKSPPSAVPHARCRRIHHRHRRAHQHDQLPLRMRRVADPRKAQSDREPTLLAGGGRSPGYWWGPPWVALAFEIIPRASCRQRASCLSVCEDVRPRSGTASAAARMRSAGSSKARTASLLALVDFKRGRCASTPDLAACGESAPASGRHRASSLRHAMQQHVYARGIEVPTCERSKTICGGRKRGKAVPRQEDARLACSIGPA